MCGNVTLMGRLLFPEKAALPRSARALLESMLRVSQMRGAQSGGGAVQIERAHRARQLIDKHVNDKRGNLGTKLARTLARTAARGNAFGGTYLVQCHVRYATAGLTSKHEAHPFRYIDAEQRGPRRVHPDGLTGGVESRPVETAVTHNGDMDGLRFRGVALPFPDLGGFFERVLGVKNRWVGDSPLLAAAMELYLTRGLWLESMRLAFQLAVAPPPPDVSALLGGLEGEARRRATAELFAKHPAPSLDVLRRWESFVEQWLQVELPFGDDPRQHRERAVTLLVERFSALRAAELPAERLVAFVRAALDAFLDNDLYIALRKLEPALEGTFGCVVTSTLEPGRLVALSRGQPLSLGFQRKTGTVCVVSERAAIKVRDAAGELAFHERLDLDLCRGEIARVALDGDGPIVLSLYGVADGRERGSEELVAAGRLVPLRDNPYVAPLPLDTANRTADDLESIPALVTDIRRAWSDPHSPNRQSAHALAELLLRRDRPRLLVMGITNDLWLARQFAHNLTTLFPNIVAEARSSNEVLLRGTRLTLEAGTIILAVSQSGQDFPTLGALVLAMQARGVGQASAFVLTGELDCLMGQAVGQSYARDAGFSQRIFCNSSGFRPSEAALATVSATQHTLCELLLCLAEHALDGRSFTKPPHGLTLTLNELQALKLRRDGTVERQVPKLVGPVGSGAEGALRRQIDRQARRWTHHVLEGVTAFIVVVLVLEANLQLRLGILPSSALGWALGRAPSELASVLRVLAAQADVAFYALLGPLVIWALRALQRRPLFHRQGTRELLIGDQPYVHQILWLLARKLFSLSYGFASIKPYSASCQDDLVLTHEPLRGTLALMGLPDRRRAALRAAGAAALMSAKQFAYSRSLAGEGAEIITVSHAPPDPGAALGAHITLPDVGWAEASALYDELTEGMFDSWERLLAMQVLLERLARGTASSAVIGFDRSRTKDQVFAPTTAAPVSAAHIYQLLARTAERYESDGPQSLPFAVVQSDWRGSAPPARTRVWREDGS